MVKLLLPLLLLTAPVDATQAPVSVCTEVYEILMESVTERQMTHKEAWAIYERCKAAE